MHPSSLGTLNSTDHLLNKYFSMHISMHCNSTTVFKIISLGDNGGNVR